ncbi:E3 ubiquitin- ligase Hakai-like [Chlorella sorokiniana]|uniref:E3 ubiquitin-ligase Hakai-like n=1 Tax=Chlorella sorokiniana TaxID=3076 RepID=A0A2P6TD40_CHLSO|nr:E3 ubiquitin- ligase Hakai-like [Chlorella sorokiniana]|eukprot:PRW20560.1 E3 ubiquitin- ligase Hakai-like [Chlorella sorokiniana]
MSSQAGQLQARQRGRRAHLCAACDFPVAVYGRCAPCLHAYCLACAAAMPACLICRALITKLERIPAANGLFISPLTLQAFRTEADLAKHCRDMGETLEALMAAGAAPQPGYAAGQQQAQAAAAGGGWKPPPPPGPPPPGAPAAHGGYGRHGQVMVPR